MKKKYTKTKVDALEHLIEETLSGAYNDSMKEKVWEGAQKQNKNSRLKSRKEKFSEFKKLMGEKSVKTIFKPNLTNFKPHLTKKKYFDLINSVIDPETGIGISDMGLIYDVIERPNGLIEIEMTLTSMGCPAGAQITTEIDSWLRLQKHVKDVKINIVWDPPWSPEMMNPDIKAMMFGN